MILSRKLSNALNDQINAEVWSSNLYMSMAVHFTVLGMDKCTSWMREKQIMALKHAYQLMEYSVSNGGQVVIGVINAVPTGYGTPKQVFEHASRHEEHLQNLLKKVEEIAVSENDTVTQDYLKSFVESQKEDESAADILDKFNQCGDESLEVMEYQLEEK